MKIRRDALFVSSVLFTIALLSVVPPNWDNALSSPGEDLDVFARMSAREMQQFGVANLATISIGLIVIWTGYIKGLRSSWFVMFIIVWIWAFPLLILPVIHQLPGSALKLSGSLWLYAIKEPGFARAVVELVLVFLLMLIGLFLPAKAFFWRKNPTTQASKPPDTA